MKRVFFLVALAGAAGTVDAAERAPAGSAAATMPMCKSRTDLRPAQKRGAPARVWPLIEEPKADLLYAVVRKRGGCIEPVYVREEVGGR